jgi:hypothetical protein
LCLSATRSGVALQNPDAPSLFCSPIKIGREASDVESIGYELPIL